MNAGKEAAIIMEDRVIFPQSRKFAYRDPAAFLFRGELYLFFSLVENDDCGQYFYTAVSRSQDLKHFSEPEILTEKNIDKNYSSPGNVLAYNGEYYLCLQTYPRPHGEAYGNEDSRIFTMKTRDFKQWSAPELLRIKGNIPQKDMGRMIDPYLLRDGERFLCFYKQNGVSFSESPDLVHWTFRGHAACGENVCVIKDGDEYLIFNSPENGINLMSTRDFRSFTSIGTAFLDQEQKPWARDRITAGFVLDIAPLQLGYRYAMFYRGDREDDYMFGATLAVRLGNDLRRWDDRPYPG